MATQSTSFGAACSPPGGKKMPLVTDTLTADEKIRALANLGITVASAPAVTIPVSGTLLADGTAAAPAGVTNSGLNINTSIQILSIGAGGGAVDVTNAITKLTTTGAGALTLADGANGQTKEIIMIADGGDATLTPTTKTGFSTIVFGDIGDAVILRFLTTVGWMLVSNVGAVAS